VDAAPEAGRRPASATRGSLTSAVTRIKAPAASGGAVPANTAGLEKRRNH